MTMTEWAEREIAAACKRENPNWDGKSFDYGCSCYQSALKAYKSLMGDGHSGCSFNVTANILKKLLNNIPLSPITDEDFFSDNYESLESDESLKARGLKSDIQCPRRSSLFRYEDLKGNVKYTDIDRCYCIDAESPSDIYSSGIDKFIDELYPIKMPYIPSAKPFKVYVRTWLTDKAHGDFDVQEVIGYIDQKDQWHSWNIFLYHDADRTKIITDACERVKLRESRIDKVEDKIAVCIIDNIYDMFLTNELWEHDRKKYDEIKVLVNNVTEKYYSNLQSRCYALAKRDEHDICYLNTCHNHHVVVNGSEEERADLIRESLWVKGLIEIVDKIKEEISSLLKSKALC